MPKTVVGLFRDPEEARAVLNDLEQTGFARNEVSLVARGGETDAATRERESEAGAGAGAAIGGAAGVVLGLASFAIPGIGPILAAGPFAVALAGAGVGAAAGGMLGALSELGVSENRAGLYAEGIRSGGTLVVVRAANDDEVERAEAILDRHDAVDIEERAGDRREAVATGLNPTARLLLDDPGMTVVPDPADPEYYEHYRRVYANKGMKYDAYANAYRFGQTLAVDPAYSGLTWDQSENDVRSRWERDHPGKWAGVKDAIRHAWDHARGNV